MNNILKFNSPGKDWMEALPLGNAKLGAMILGGVRSESIFLNEETFWAGTPIDNNNYDANKHLDCVREHILKDELQEARELIENHMLSNFNQPYQPLGKLVLDFLSTSAYIADYSRILDMEKGMLTVSYKSGGKIFNHEYFCSNPDGVFVMKLSCPTPDITFKLIAEGNAKSNTIFGSDGTLSFSTVAPSKVDIADVYTFPQDSNVLFESENSIKGNFYAKIITDGQLMTGDNSFTVENSKETILYLCAATNFNNSDPHTVCKNTVDSAVNIGFDLLKQRHVLDFSALYNKISLTINPTKTDYISIENLLKKKLVGDNPEILTELLFNYGRYLLISSSRNGSLPATLQGIWNQKEIPPWWSNWTMNINLEMNYWLANKCGLNECAQPLYDFIGKLSKKGRETAKVHYNCNGWTSHHMTDIWLNTSPIGFDGKPHKHSASWAMWNMAAPWLCLFLWDEYLYTDNKTFLRDFAYPIMKEALDFLLDWQILVDGKYETLPSTSPEAIYIDENGQENSVCKSSAMDIQIITEFYRVMLKAVAVLETNPELIEILNHRLSTMPKITVGSYCNILEWDKDYTQQDLGHRHFSHLFGLYPGDSINNSTPELMAAAKKSLEVRLTNGSASTSWSCVWAICLAARTGDESLAYQLIVKFLKEDIFANLFSYHPPNYFQIDGNLGFTAAMLELLVEDRNDIIRLLPALPAKWHTGSFNGFVLKGGDILAIDWEDGKLKSSQIYANSDGTLNMALCEDFIVTALSETLIVKSTNKNCSFEKKKGITYAINPV